MTSIVIAKFKLQEGQEAAWAELSEGIQAGISQAPGFISRDAGSDEEGNHYCIVKFDSKEQREASQKAAQEAHPEMFEKFGQIVDMQTMTKTELDVV